MPVPDSAAPPKIDVHSPSFLHPGFSTWNDDFPPYEVALLVPEAPNPPSSSEWMDIRSSIGYLPGMIPSLPASSPVASPPAEPVAPLRVLVIGRDKKIVLRALKQNIARFGQAGRPLTVTWHWEDHVERALPTGCEVVYLVCNEVSHNLTEVGHTLARRAGIPCVSGTTKWSQTISRMKSAGFTPLVEETLLSAAIGTAGETVGVMRRGEWLRRTLCIDPSLSNPQISEKMIAEANGAFFVYEDGAQIAKVRETLGITVVRDRRKGHRDVVVDWRFYFSSGDPATPSL